MSEEKRKVYHYLHNSASGITEADSVFSDDSLVALPINGTVHTVVLKVDSRDKRTIVAFDGDIPWGGLPKGGDVIKTDFLGRLTRSVHNIRYPRPEEEKQLWHIYDDGKNEATLTLRRHFLLLPKSVSCIRRYDNRSLRPIYTFIEVDEKGVTWRTSSY